MSKCSASQHVFEEEARERVCIYCGLKVFKKSNYKPFLYVFGPSVKEKELSKYIPCVKVNSKVSTQTNTRKSILTLKDPRDPEYFLDVECDNVFQDSDHSNVLSSIIKSVVMQDDHTFGSDDFIKKPYNVMYVFPNSPEAEVDHLLMDPEKGLLVSFYSYLKSLISTVKKHQFKFIIQFSICYLPLRSDGVVDLQHCVDFHEERNPDTVKISTLYNGFENVSKKFTEVLKFPLKMINLSEQGDRPGNAFVTFVLKRFSVSKNKLCVLSNKFHFVNLKWFGKKISRGGYQESIQQRYLRKRGYGDFGNKETKLPGDIRRDVLQNGAKNSDLLFKGSVLSYIVKRNLSIPRRSFIVNMGIVSGNRNNYEQTKKVVEFMIYCKEGKDSMKSLIQFFT